MTAVTYTARRSISAGHVVGGVYSLDFSPRVINPTKTTIKEESVSLAGYTQTVVDRRDALWQFETVQLLETDAAFSLMLEFMDSVDESEQFTVDVYGSIATPISPVPAILTRNYDMRRIEQNPEWVFSFELRVLPA